MADSVNKQIRFYRSVLRLQKAVRRGTGAVAPFKTFRVRFVDPDTLEQVSMERRFGTTPAKDGSSAVSARDWAEDWAYAAADKGPYEITEIAP